MSDPDLIDNIVSNETLGIRKKTHLLKIFVVLILVSCLGFLGYTYYTKQQAEAPQPALDLGQPIATVEAAAQSSQIMPAEQVPVVAPEQIAVSQPPIAQSMPAAAPVDQLATAPIQPASAEIRQPAPVADQQPLSAIHESVSATLAEGEAVVEKPVPVKRKASVKKPVVKKKAPAPEVEMTYGNTEEGVTQEEIIVFQKD